MGRGQVAALYQLDLDVAEGAFVAVVGRSGSGKSTLLHLLAALEQPSAGTLSVGPWHLGGLGPDEQARYRREMVGIVFQQFHLVPTMTALENVELPLVLAGAPRAARRERARACLDLVEMTHRLEHRPVELSGGEQQRVAIARALVHDPPLLLADEPTGNLDSATGAQIIALLDRLHREQGRTVLAVTHNLAELDAVASRILTLHDGRVRPKAMR